MADRLQLEVVTPDKMVVSAAVDRVQIPGKSGCLGILPGHAPLITELAVGKIRYYENGTAGQFAVSRGIAEVLPDKVTILAETPDSGDEIIAKRTNSVVRTGKAA